MWSLVTSLGMVDALSAYHHHDAGELLAAILAGVLGFLGSLIELVAAFVGAVRMAGTGGGGERPHVGELVPAVLTIVIFLFHFVCVVIPVR